MSHGRIYCVTNAVNGKQYVGQTIQPLDVRWRQHAQCFGRCRAIENAIKKYGREAFSIRELATASSQVQLDALEQFWIENLGTVSPRGYNLSGGGGGVGKMHGETKEILRAIGRRPERIAQLNEMRRQPDVKEKQRESLRARWRESDLREKIVSAAQSPQAKAKRSAKLSARWRDPVSRARMLEVLGNVQRRPDMRARRAETTASAWNEPGERERRAAAIRAALNSPEVKAKRAAIEADPNRKARLSAIASGRRRTDEQRREQSLRQTGRKHKPHDREYLTPEFLSRRGAAIRAAKARNKSAG